MIIQLLILLSFLTPKIEIDYQSYIDKYVLLKPKVAGNRIVLKNTRNAGKNIQRQFFLASVDGFIGNFYLSSYYTPVKNQKTYFNGSYSGDYRINCSGDCSKTASGYTLQENDANRVVACPPNMKFGTTLKMVNEHGTFYVICRDRGGAIKGNRLDLWIGYGQEGEEKPWIQYSSKNTKVYIVTGSGSLIQL